MVELPSIQTVRQSGFTRIECIDESGQAFPMAL